MKKIIIVVALVAIILTTAAIMGCNMNPGLGTYSFKKVHILAHNGEEKCFEISSWRDTEIGCEVKLKNGGSLWLSEGTYILVSDKCPICDHE